MSPYPAQVHHDQIISTARVLIEESGIEALSLGKLAEALHIKAPSLYKHIQSKADLVREVNLRTIRELVAAITAASQADGEPVARFLAMGRAYREFALACPVMYSLAFSNIDKAWRPDPALLEALAIPLQQAIGGLSGGTNSLTALRGAWALMHGYLLIEIGGQFQRGGDLENAYYTALQTYAEGLIARKHDSD